MKTLIPILLFIFFTYNLFCQSFTVHLSPDTIVVNQGETATLQVTASVTDGYNASIFLSLQEFQTSSVNITPNPLNSPYTNGIVTVSTNNCSNGINRLIIKGEQSNLVSYDTAYIVVMFNPDLKWYQFTNQNSGIPGNDIYNMDVDKNNNVWLCTNNGLVKYDRNNWYIWGNGQYKITNFWGSVIFQEADEMIKINDVVSSIGIDTNDVKWIGTYNGLIKFDGTNYEHLFNGEYIINIACRNNRVCVGTINNGFKYFDGTDWFSYTTANSFLPDNCISRIAFENDTTLWLANIGLVRFDSHFWTIYNHTNSIMTYDAVGPLAIDSENSIFFSTCGAQLMKLANGEFFQYQTPCSEISTIYSDPSGNIWLGYWSGETNNSLVKFDGTNFTVFNSSNSGFNSDATTIGNGRIHCIKKDGNGDLMIGSFGDGLFVYDENNISSFLPAELIFSQTYPFIPINFNIFPNPTCDLIYIESPNETYDYNYTVFDLKGREIINLISHSKLVQLDLSHFEKGIYLIKIRNNNSIITKKIIKI